MAILALENDPARAATLRQIACGVLKTELTLVESKADFKRALTTVIPEVVLLPALLSPADEAELVSHLSERQASGHIEMLITPFAFASESPQSEAPRGWRGWLEKRDEPAQNTSCAPWAFAEQLAWSIRRAHDVRRDQAQELEWKREMEDAGSMDLVCSPTAVDYAPTPVDCAPPPADCAPTSDNPSESLSERRAHHRFSAQELAEIRVARIEHGPDVKLIDCSVGGALLESEIPLPPGSGGALELIGEHGQFVVPFRVVRCSVSAVEHHLLYWCACAFTVPLNLDVLLQPVEADQESMAPPPIDPFDIDVEAIVDRYMSMSLAHLMKRTAPVSEQISSIALAEPLASEEPPASIDGADRRRYVRVAGRYDGRRSGSITSSVVINSLSEVGCFVESFHEEAKGRRLSLELRLTDGEWIAVNAEVVRSEPEFGFGVRFVEMSSDIRERLAREVAARTVNAR